MFVHVPILMGYKRSEVPDDVAHLRVDMTSLPSIAVDSIDTVEVDDSVSLQVTSSSLFQPSMFSKLHPILGMLMCGESFVPACVCVCVCFVLFCFVCLFACLLVS